MSEQTTTNGRMNLKESVQVDRITVAQAEEALDGQAELSADQLESMRSVLAIFLGGSGHLTALHLKAGLIARFGKAWRQKIRILVFDTSEEPYVVQMGKRRIRLEPESEFFNIGNVPVPKILANIDNLDSIQERFESVLNRIPVASLRNGAKCIPPLGLMAFYWHYPTIFEQLRRALWNLAERDQYGAEVALQQQGINVFIGGSFVGGTASGMFLDMAALVRSLFDELGTQSEFCHITGVAFLPQAFPGVPPTKLYANAGASLQEVNHLMIHGDFSARYPDGRLVRMRQAPFDLLYVLDGVDERGQTWSSIVEVAAMAAEGIFLQMGSQLGRKGDNVFDNMDEVLMNRTPDGEQTCLASFGLGYLEFPAPEVAGLCTRWLLADLIKEQWLKATKEDENVDDELDGELQAVAPDQLSSILLRDPDGGGELRLDLRQPGWLKNKGHDEVAAEAAQYVREYGHARVNEGLLRKIGQNGEAHSRRQQEAWTDWTNTVLFAPEVSLHDVLSTLKQARARLMEWRKENRRRLVELEKASEERAVTVSHKETAVARAATSLVIGRSGRIRAALDSYFQVAHEWYELQVQIGDLQARRRIWSQLADHVHDLERQVRMMTDRLETIAAQTRTKAEEQMRMIQDGGVSRLSLADEAYVRRLYRLHAPDLVNLPAQLESGSPLALADQHSNELENTLLSTLGHYFEPVRQMDIETVIAARSEEMSPRARRQQLFRLATPSWSVDRVRLPQGGSELKRIEVMGVPNAGDTLYDDEATRVSTHDPYRLAALVVVAGAPASALQQHDRYLQMMDKVRASHPVHVLPHFLADAGRAKLAFALGSIFGFIYSQGTYFYYQPGDELKGPQLLENGLANAVTALEADENLVREIMERVDAQIVRLGLQRAIEVLTDYYSSAPEGHTSLDELARELKQRVRDYADELRQISDHTSGLKS